MLPKLLSASRNWGRLITSHLKTRLRHAIHFFTNKGGSRRPEKSRKGWIFFGVAIFGVWKIRCWCSDGGMCRGSAGARLRGMGRGSAEAWLRGMGRGSPGARLRDMGRGNHAITALGVIKSWKHILSIAKSRRFQKLKISHFSLWLILNYKQMRKT